MSGPSVIVTGSGGLVGGRVVRALEAGGTPHRVVRHDEALDEVRWSEATHVVNAAAVTPGPEVTAERYWDGNVTWIERLLPHLAGLDVVHFGTVSTLYRVGPYQASKLVGESLLRMNADGLRSLHVVPVPTLDDAALVEGLARRADAGERPTVTELHYSWCSVDELARHVVEDLVGGAGGPLRVETRVLSERVRARATGTVETGDRQDRTGRAGGVWRTNEEARRTFLDTWE